MGFLTVIFLLSSFYILFGPKTASAKTFDVTSYGAVGDGNTFDTDAFVKAWEDLCGDTTKDPTLIIPSGKTFLISCMKFSGPCRSYGVHIKLLGDITAPKTRDGWQGCDIKGYLLHFTNVKRLIIDGPGQIDGQGSIWWPREQFTMLRFENCNDLQIRGTRHINSPKSHVSLEGCKYADLGNLHISAPEHSPNTDGIDLSWSAHVNIHDSVIQTGDDCVAINGGTFDINVTGILCGPGHGISIGSLGRDGSYTTVKEVRVQNCNLTGTTNGVRIKTGGTGYARSIAFKDIHLENVKNPIIIDQHYCIDMTNADCHAPGFLMFILLSSFYILLSPKTASAETFDVTSYGAVGDGDTFDTDAFVRAWEDLCGDTTEDPTLIIPSDKTFLLSCVRFSGPCQSSSVHIKLLGDISAPKTVDGWQGCDIKGFLLHFVSVNGLIIDGPGQLDGHGDIWWPHQQITPDGILCNCPSMLRFENCDGLQLQGTRHINGPKSHIMIKGSRGVDLGNLHISAPEESANTDGIDISWSSQVNIHDSVIESGDDCLAINGGTFDINVTGILCGPGHGISVGSLGKHNSYSTVEQVRVQNCNLTGTTNGLRIKTVPGGTGYARSITFEDIHLENVKNPIIIDQHYCTDMTNADCRAPPTAPAVKVSDITYRNIHGSSAAKKAIIFNCIGKYKCNRIETDDVGITGDNVYAYCFNARGNFMNTSPEIINIKYVDNAQDKNEGSRSANSEKATTIDRLDGNGDIRRLSDWGMEGTWPESSTE
ncbi:hypothetical protein SSX86_001162 [Deinandra increscens subsp. villosa]|uniref:Uncharacterized protein n=1 Tax=Deinandra increscens subsp. villosa TaxID=3103831 RepID=A0AAP0DU99_9ASTR